MSDLQNYTLFSGGVRIASGDLQAVALAAHNAHANGTTALVAFSDQSGRPVDLDLRGSSADVRTRYSETSAQSPKATRGRPKLGVVPREVTLLPRHWEWLGDQPGGASAALRRLVDQARRDRADSDRRREVQEAAHRVMTALAGNLANYEDALRAFYLGDQARFLELIEAWPVDVRIYVQSLCKEMWAYDPS